MHISLRHRGTKYDLLELAFGHGTPKKAFLTALVIGTILTTINHGDNLPLLRAIQEPVLGSLEFVCHQRP
jgi:hypothetical protein